MSFKLPNEQISLLKLFIKALKADAQILYTPELAFFKEYLESIGGKIPEKKTPTSSPTTEDPKSDAPKSDSKNAADSDSDDIPDYVEEDMDMSLINNEGVIEPESDPLPEQYEYNGEEISEENRDLSDEHRSQALNDMSEGKFTEAIDSFTKAIKCNPDSAVLYAKRANALLKLKRVKAVIADCDQAIKRNPDSALAHKLRGRAYRLLGEWKNAAIDLRKACNLDCDEQAIEWLNEVTPNANKIEEHQRTQQRKKDDIAMEQKKQRVRRARKENQKAAQRQKESNQFEGMPGSDYTFGKGAGGMPDMGGMPGAGGGMGGFADLFNDPDIMQGLQDPELRKVFTEMNMNPEAMGNYKDNPKVQKFMEKLSNKFGGGAGSSSPFPGFDMGNSASETKSTPTAEPTQTSTLDDLD